MQGEFMQYLYVFFLSMIPIVEQRGAIPLGILAYNLNPIAVFLVALMGSIVPVPFILIFLTKVLEWMEKVKYLDKIAFFVKNKLQNSAKRLKKIESIALIAFVAIPLPGTGLWTGSGISVLLGLNSKKSFYYIVLGGIISAIAITLLCIYIPGFFGKV